MSPRKRAGKPGKEKRKRLRRREEQARRARPNPSLPPEARAALLSGAVSAALGPLARAVGSMFGPGQYQIGGMGVTVEKNKDAKAPPGFTMAIGPGQYQKGPEPVLVKTQRGHELRKVGEFVDDRLAIVYSLCSEGTEWTPRARDRILALIDEIRAGCERAGTPLRRVMSQPPQPPPRLWEHQLQASEFLPGASTSSSRPLPFPFTIPPREDTPPTLSLQVPEFTDPQPPLTRREIP